MDTRSRVAGILDDAASGSSGVDRTMDLLVPLVYDELRKIAQKARRDLPATPTLATTALVHEAYLRCIDDTRITRGGKAYFFGALSRAMRQLLIEAARRRETEKRGAGVPPVTLDDKLPGEGEQLEAFAESLLDLDRALLELEEKNPRLVRVVECRYFAELTVEETAAAVGVSPRTVKTDWSLARAWLARRLKDGP